MERVRNHCNDKERMCNLYKTKKQTCNNNGCNDWERIRYSHISVIMLYALRVMITRSNVMNVTMMTVCVRIRV